MQGFDEIYSDSKYESEELYSVVATGRQSYDVPTSSDFCEPIVSRDYSWCGVPGVVASRMAALGLQNPIPLSASLVPSPPNQHKPHLTPVTTTLPRTSPLYNTNKPASDTATISRSIHPTSIPTTPAPRDPGTLEFMSIENLKTFGEFAPPVRETALHYSLRPLWQNFKL